VDQEGLDMLAADLSGSGGHPGGGKEGDELVGGVEVVPDRLGCAPAAFKERSKDGSRKANVGVSATFDACVRRVTARIMSCGSGMPRPR
jgi:hypothetical protein